MILHRDPQPRKTAIVFAPAPRNGSAAGSPPCRSHEAQRLTPSSGRLATSCCDRTSVCSLGTCRRLPYVCPEPVLVNARGGFSIKWRNRVCCLPVTIGRALALYACRDGPIHRGKLLLDGAAAEHEDERDGSIGKPCTAATLFTNGLLWGEFPLYSVSLISLVLLSRACHGK